MLSGKRQLLPCPASLDCENTSPVFLDLLVCEAEAWITAVTMLSFKNGTRDAIFPVHILNYVCVRSLAASDGDFQCEAHSAQQLPACLQRVRTVWPAQARVGPFCTAGTLPCFGSDPLVSKAPFTLSSTVWTAWGLRPAVPLYPLETGPSQASYHGGSKSLVGSLSRGSY